jgi:protein-disulfide isomerase
MRKQSICAFAIMVRMGSYKKPYLLTALITTAVIAFLGSIQFLHTRYSQSEQTGTNTAESVAADDIQLVLGDLGASFSFIEYIDYKCSSCARFHEKTWPEIKERVIDTGEAKLILKNIPFIGPDSRRAANAGYCAAEQGLFEPFHNKVYAYTYQDFDRHGEARAREDILTAEVLISFATESGADKTAFSDCLSEKRYDQQITRDLKASEADQVSGTPTFIIGAQKITGPQPARVLIPLIEANR